MLIQNNDSKSQKPAIIIPDLNYLDSIESLISKTKSIIFDTNIVIPPIKFKKNNSDVNLSLHDFLFQDSITLQDCRFYMKAVDSFQMDYLSKYDNILSKNDSLITTKRVLDELLFFKRKSLEISRANTKKREHMNLYAKSVWRYIRKSEKIIANGIDSVIFTLDNKNLTQNIILDDSKVSDAFLYNSLFDIIKQTSKFKGIDFNSYQTDLHLLTSAFYLSLKSGDKVDVISYDKHIIQLLGGSSYYIKGFIKNRFKKSSLRVKPYVNLIKTLYDANSFKLTNYAI
jgi:hypothetical protein